MSNRQIKENIYAVGALDSERRLFDELIPLPDGTTYNSYIIKGRDKTVLLDTVDPTKTDILIESLKSLNITKIDYVIAHHGEQDHSGSIPKILELYPMAKVAANEKCKAELIDLLLIPENKFMTIADRQTLSLGDKTLEFIFTPWVHWPETMATYLKEDKILFTCDFFGSHLAQSSLYADDWAKVYDSAKRYYAEIMMPFRTNIINNIEKLKNLQIDMICPSHGPVYKEPQKIIEAYKNWISDEVKNEVIIPYVSMHGSTAKMVEYFVDALVKKGITVKTFDLSKTDIGELAKSLIDAATIVVGTPTVLAGAHPQAAYAAFLANALRPKTKYLSIIGSYGWGGRVVEQLAGMTPNLKVEVIDPVLIKGYPKEADFKAIDALAEAIHAKHQNDPTVKK